MAAKVDIPFRAAFSVARPRDKVYGYLAKVKTAIPGNFPGVERFEETGPDTFRWTFESLSYGGHHLAIGFVTRFVFSPEDKIVMEPSGTGSRLNGSWTLREQGGNTEVTFQAHLELELPIPFFLKGMAAPVAQKEITKLFERYIGRVSTNILA
jgi:carbon monoxide dehydrogenase subunit G